MVNHPPRDVWIAGSTGLTRWRPEFDHIQVYGAADGKVLRLCISGVTHEIVLSVEQAEHLAGLLGAP